MSLLSLPKKLGKGGGGLLSLHSDVRWGGMSISIQSYKLCREEGRVSLFMQSVKLEKGGKPALSSFSQRS